MNMNVNPMISVIIPTYKRNDTLNRAINSVLNQSYQDFELIVVDDNDKGNEYSIANEKLMNEYKDNERVIYIQHEKNKNGSAARNTGIKQSKGKYISLLDDDDEFMEDKLEMQLNELIKNPQYDAVYCQAHLVRDDVIVNDINNNETGNLQDQLLTMDNSIGNGSTLLIKKDVVVSLGGYDESFKRHQDWEFLVRFFREHEIGCVNKHIVKIHVDSEISQIKDPVKFEEMKFKYLNTFKSDIEKLDKNTQNMIYRNHYYQIARTYMVNKKIMKSFKWCCKACKQKWFSKKQSSAMFKEFVKCFISIESIKKIRGGSFSVK